MEQSDPASDLWDGEFWNSDLVTQNISRVRFGRNDDGTTIVEAWGACFPRDCEWGETKLNQLMDLKGLEDGRHAFATWNEDSDPTHCLMTLVDETLTVVCVAIRSDMPSYRVTEKFCKDAARSEAAKNADPVDRFQNMWDGSEPGWKLVRHATDLHFVEFEFDSSGPTRAELDVVHEYIEAMPGESDEQEWERLRGCAGIGLGRPLGPEEIERVRTKSREHGVRMTEQLIAGDDYLVLKPNGTYYPWIMFSGYRSEVVERMLAAGVEIVSR